MTIIPNGFSKLDITQALETQFDDQSMMLTRHKDHGRPVTSEQEHELEMEEDIIVEITKLLHSVKKDHLLANEIKSLITNHRSWPHGYNPSDVLDLIRVSLTHVGLIEPDHRIFETATAGGTSSGSIASAVTPMGATQKRKKKMNKPAKNALDQDVNLLGGPAYKGSSGIYEGIMESNLPGYDDWKQNPYAHEPSEQDIDDAWRSAKTYFDKFLTTDETQMALNDIRNPDTDPEDRAGIIQDLISDFTGVIRNTLVNQDGVDYIETADIANYVRRRLRTEQDIQGSFTESNNHDAKDEEDEKIYFTIDDEKAFEAVMNRYTDYVDWSGDYLTASPEVYNRIADLAYSMGSEAVEKGSEGFVSEISKKKLRQYVDATGADDQMGKDREKGSRLATNKIRASQKSTKKNPVKYSKVVGKDASAKDRSSVSTKYKPKVAATEGSYVVPSFDRERYQERPGLEGPFGTKSGKVIYYDPKEGKYYDPDSDFYISYEDYKALTEGKKKGIVGYNDGSAMCQNCKRHWDKDEIKGTVADLRQSHKCKDDDMNENDLPGYDAWKTDVPDYGEEQYEADQEALPAIFDVVMDRPEIKAMRAEIQDVNTDKDDREGLIQDYMSDIASYMLDFLDDEFEGASVIDHSEVLEWVKGQFYGTKAPRDMPKSMVGLKSKVRSETAEPNQLKGKDKAGKATKQGPYLKHPAKGKLVGEDIVESIRHLSGIKKDK